MLIERFNSSLSAPCSPLKKKVPGTGLEPAHQRHLILSQARLPMPPHRQRKGSWRIFSEAASADIGFWFLVSRPDVSGLV